MKYECLIVIWIISVLLLCQKVLSRGDKYDVVVKEKLVFICILIYYLIVKIILVMLFDN